MGDALAIASTGFEIAGQTRDYNAQVRAFNQAQKNIVIETNYALQNYEFERMQAMTETVNDLLQTHKQTSQQVASVDTAVLQEVGSGRTADALMRATRNMQAETLGSIKEKYRNVSGQIDLNKEQTVLSANNQLRSMATPTKPNYMATFIKGATSYMGAKEQQAVLRDRQNINKGNIFTGSPTTPFTPLLNNEFSGNYVFSNQLAGINKVTNVKQPMFNFTSNLLI